MRLAQIFRKLRQCGERQMMSFAARDPRHRDHHQPVFRQTIGQANLPAFPWRAEPEFRYAEIDRADPAGVDGKPLAEQRLGIAAVGDDLRPRPEHAGAAYRHAFQPRLRLVDLGAMHRHQYPRRRSPSGKRERNEERPIGGMDHIVSIAADAAAGQHDLGRHVAHGMKTAAKPNDLEGQGPVVVVRLPRVIGRQHGDLCAEPAGGRGNFAGVGPDASHRGSELAGQQQDVQPGALNRSAPRRQVRAHPEFPDDSGTPARAGCPG